MIIHETRIVEMQNFATYLGKSFSMQLNLKSFSSVWKYVLVLIIITSL